MASLAFALFTLGAATHVAAAQAMDTLRIATTPNDSGAIVYYADELGVFKKAGLSVQITALRNSGMIGSGIASGSFDIGIATVPAIASAHVHGLPFVIIAPCSDYISTEPTNQLVVMKNSTIRSAADFDGKIVGVAGLQNSAHIAAMAWIDKHGGTSANVKFIELSYSEMLPALQAGRIDGASISEPFLSPALPSVRSIGAPYDAIAGNFILSVWFTRADYVKSHPEIVRKFNEVMLETAKWANAHPAQSAEIMERQLKVPTLPGAIRIRYSERMAPGLLQPLLDAAARYNVIKAIIPASDLLATLTSR